MSSLSSEAALALAAVRNVSGAQAAPYCGSRSKLDLQSKLLISLTTQRAASIFAAGIRSGKQM